MSNKNSNDEDVILEIEKNSIFNQIIAFSLQKRKLIAGLSFLIFTGGSFIAYNLSVDVLPNLNRPVVTVLMEAHGLAPKEVETLVTIPLESALNGAPGVQKIRSVSKRGIAILQVEFEWGTNVYTNRQIVSEKLVTAAKDLPSGIAPIMGPISSIMGEIQLIGLSSKKGQTSLREIRTLADWTIRKRLLTIPGISNVVVMGGEAKEYHILLDSERLAFYNIPLKEIYESLTNMSNNTSGGFVEKDSKEFIIRNIGAIYEISEMENAVVGFKAGLPVKLKQIAEVKISHRVKMGDASISGKQGVILAIQKQPDADTIYLSKNVDLVLSKIKPTISDDIQIIPHLFRQSEFIERAVGNVVEAIRDGSVIVALILFVFLWNFRTTFITLTALPLSLISGVLVLQLFGYGVNTMTLGGLAVAIGLLVDDAIVDTENIFRRLKENWARAKPRPILQVVYDASSEVRSSIVLATVIVVLVFMPLLFLSGVEGRIFQPMALAFIFSLFASLAVALTLTPVLCYYLLPELTKKIKNESFVVRHLKNFHAKNLNFLMGKPVISFGLVLFLFSGSVVVFPFLGREFLPPFNEGTLTLEVVTPAGTSLSESVARATLVEQICLQTKGVGKLSRRTGRSEMDEHAEGVHYSEFDVSLDPEKAGRLQSEIVAELRSKFKTIKGVSVNVGQPISHRLDHLLSGIKAEVAIFVYGTELEPLMLSSYHIESLLKDIPGVVDLFIETQSYAPELKISIRHDMASKYGISVGELTEILELALNGHVVSKLIEEQKIYDIRVLLDQKIKTDLDKLSKHVIRYLPDATPVTLGMVTEIYESAGPYEIKRENSSRRIAVQFNVGDGKDLASVVEQVDLKLKNELKLDPGYYYEIGGRYASQQNANYLIMVLSLGSLIVIIGILYGYFRSWIYTGQIILNIPLSFIGGVFALYITNVNISIASIVGFIALAGIASRNGIMMISHFNHLMREEGEVFSMQMVIRGSLERIVPVLMTVFTAIFALLPILLTGSEAPGKEILYPVSVVIVGGLMSSTMLDLILTPVIYYMAGKRFPDLNEVQK